MRTLRQAHTALSRLLARRRARNEKGLTTLEWLLIVAAVAGLAALAIVLVQGVVDDTAEDIRGSSARGQAALVAGQAVIDEAKAGLIFGNFGAGNKYPAATDWTQYFNGKCRRLGITYSDADIVVTAQFADPTLTASAVTKNAADDFAKAPSDTASDCHVKVPAN